MHNGEDGSIWGQNVVNGEVYPNYSGVVVGAEGVYTITMVLPNGKQFKKFRIQGQAFSLPSILDGQTIYGWREDSTYKNTITSVNNINADITLYALSIGQDDNGCYEIGSRGELLAFSQVVAETDDGACGKLIDNIVFNQDLLDENGNLNGSSSDFVMWKPIGSSNRPFRGTFDGQGYTITGLYYYNHSTDGRIGLFGTVGSNSYGQTVIQNVGLVDSYIDGYSYVGGLIGYITGNYADVALKNCFNVGTVKGSYTVGGLVGYPSYNLIIQNSYVLGKISATSSVGGLVGYDYFKPDVSNSFYHVDFVYGVMNSYGTEMPLDAFTNGYVAILLRGNDDASVWGQNVTEGDKFPNFSCGVVGGPEKKMAYLHYAENDVESFTYYEGFGKLPVPYQDGKKFLGWFLTSDFSDAAISDISSGLENNTVIYARWLEMSEPAIVDECYQIASVSDLYGFAAIVNGTFAGGRNAEYDACGTLTRDITINSDVIVNGSLNSNHDNFIQWTPIGLDKSKNFSGMFDGGNHTIYGLYINNDSAKNAGLFGVVVGDDTLNIKRVSIADAYIRASENIGGMIGRIFAYDNAVVNISNVSVSGFLGVNEDAQYVGGIVGNIAGDYGSATIKVNIDNSYNVASVIGYSRLGGLVGNAVEFLKMKVDNSYNAGAVSGEEYVGGLVGFVGNAVKLTTDNYFYLDNVVGETQMEYGNLMSTQLLANGSIANLLREGTNGSIWGQNVPVDQYPNFGGVLTGAESLPVVTLHYSESNVSTLLYVPGIERNLPATYGGENNEEFAVLGWFDNAELSGTGIKKISKNSTGDKEFWAKSLKTDGCVAIGSADELYNFANRVNEGETTLCGVLVDDIVVNEDLTSNKAMYSYDGALVVSDARRWEPIGSYNSPFRGTFDGRGYTISGLYFPDCYDFEESSDFVCDNRNSDIGLFGWVGLRGRDSIDYELRNVRDSIVIKNLGIRDSYFKGYSGIGSIVGRSGFGSALTIANCFSEAIVDSYNGGGLVGEANGDFYVYNSYFAGKLTGSNGSAVAYILNSERTHTGNNFCLNVSAPTDNYNYAQSPYAENVGIEAFSDRSVALRLHNYNENGVDGSIWGQELNSSFPMFSGIVDNPPSPKTVVLHSFGSQQSYSYFENISKKFPVFAEEGYIFVGWYDNENYNGDVLTEIPSDEGDFYAKWFSVMKPNLVDDCYEIATTEELYGFAAIVNGSSVLNGNSVEKNLPKGDVCGKLTNNIVVNNILDSDGNFALNGTSFMTWIPIGSGNEFVDPETENRKLASFSGSFDGQGYTISGLYSNSDSNNVGLFGYVSGESVAIENVGIVGSYLKGAYNVGALVGYANETDLHITNSFNKSFIEGDGNVAGLVGEVQSSSITIANSYNEGEIYSRNGNEVAGLIGYASYSNILLKNVYNAGDIYGYGYVAGLIGYVSNSVSNTTYVYNSHNIGLVDGSYAVQAVVGNSSYYQRINGDFVFDCYYLSGTTSYFGGKGTSAKEFADGTVAKALHAYNQNDVDGSIWGQNVTGGDAYPKFTGEVIKRVVTLHYGEGDEDEMNPLETRIFPIPERDGRMFVGWYLTADFSGDAVAEVPVDLSEDLVVYAKWMDVKKPKFVDGCYEIATAEELYGFAAIVNGNPVIEENSVVQNSPEVSACGKLTANIFVNKNVLDANGSIGENAVNFVEWIPIGSSEHPFEGTFEGQGHVISGLYFDKDVDDEMGLFGVISGEDTVVIQNVGVEDSYLRSSGDVGGFVASSDACIKLVNVFAKGTFASARLATGGFVGYMEGSLNVKNGYVAAKVSDGYIGADLVGYIASYASVNVENFYYLNKAIGNRKDEYESRVTRETFAKGVVALFLHNDENGSIWGQNVMDGEIYPNFSGVLVGEPSVKTVVLHYAEGEESSFEYMDGYANLPVPSRDGYLFAGWFLNSNYSGKFVSSVPENIDENSVIYAKWLEITKPRFVDECYEIATVGELYGFAAVVNGTVVVNNGTIEKNNPPENSACGKLTADIIVNQNVLNADGSLSADSMGFISWNPIGFVGSTGNFAVPFSGSFDGRGHIISGLYYNKDDGYAGLFGYIASDTVVVKNVGVVDSYILGLYAGGLAGAVELDYMELSNVFVKARILSDYGVVGGFISIIYGNLDTKNSYSMVVTPKDQDDALIGYARGNTNFVNTYYLSDQRSAYGSVASASEFTNGTVARALHDYNSNGVDGSIWGQNVGVDPYPNFSGTINTSVVVTLDWQSPSDVVVLADSIFAPGTVVRIAEGKEFYDNGAIYSGILSDEMISYIGDRTLYPISGVDIDGNGSDAKLTIDGESGTPVVVSADISTMDVRLDRGFTPNVFSSVVLPFSIPRENVSGASFYQFTGVKKVDDRWVFAVKSKFGDDLVANHPYVVKPTDDHLTFSGNVTLNTERNRVPQVEGGWKFVGAYEYKEWLEGNAEIGKAYGIAAQDAGTDIKAGDFVKVSAGASVSPTRGYLVYEKTSAPGRPAALGESFAGITALPDFMDIVVEDEGEQPMVIGTFNTRTGEIKASDDRWFNMNGRILNAKPTQKGTYFHQGKRVIIK